MPPKISELFARDESGEYIKIWIDIPGHELWLDESHEPPLLKSNIVKPLHPNPEKKED
jgi:hypothetical protein